MSLIIRDRSLSKLDTGDSAKTILGICLYNQVVLNNTI